MFTYNLTYEHDTLDEKKALVGRFLGDVTDSIRDDVYSLIEQLLFIEMSMGK